MDSRKRTLILIAIILGAMLVSVMANLTITLIQDASHPVKYEEIVEKYASQYNVPEYIVYAVINTESKFDPNSKSSDGALGLMQMTPDTFKYIASDEHLDEDTEFESLTDPETSIRFGAYYLRYLFNEFKNWSAAYAAYDAGEAQVREWLSDPTYSKDGETLKKIPLAETKKYVSKTESAADYYKDKYYRNGVSVK